MTWTYLGQPGTGSTQAQLDAVRFLAGQTSSQDPVLLADEEAAFLLVQAGSVYTAAAMAADQLAGKYAAKATSKTVGDLSLGYQTRGQEYRALATSLRYQAAMRATPYASGISVADKLVVTSNTDRVQPAFAVGRDDNPRGTSQNSTGPAQSL